MSLVPTTYNSVKRLAVWRSFDTFRSKMTRNWVYQPTRGLTSSQAFTALKPFFFAVHPDLFGRYPKERAVNENSLKQLNAYIESASLLRESPSNNVVFYLKKQCSSNVEFQSINVQLGKKDVKGTVQSILKKCNLPTHYLDSLKDRKETAWFENATSINSKDKFYSKTKKQFWENIEDQPNFKDGSPQDLIHWLEKNVDSARSKLRECWPIREEIIRLRKEICKTLGLKALVWDCGWGTRHFRGCLQSFNALMNHYPTEMLNLTGKTVVFGRETGVSLDGYVILNSGEVRANWFDLIKNVKGHDESILRIPSVDRALSRVLLDIKIVHRKFEPIRLAKIYESHIIKLTTAMGDYRGRAKYPLSWPDSLSYLELVVETEAGPLMLSPTGQIIVPSSCPPFLLVNFISENMDEAAKRLHQYKQEKHMERDLIEKCINEFQLVELQKDDNVTPNLMIKCCTRMLNLKGNLKDTLHGVQLWITNGYYSILSDGEVCIPWDWKGSKL